MVGVKSPTSPPPRGKAQLCADVFISLPARHLAGRFMMLTILLTSARDPSRVQACLIPYFGPDGLFFLPDFGWTVCVVLREQRSIPLLPRLINPRAHVFLSKGP